VAATADGWRTAWTGLSWKRRVALLILLAFAILIAAGAAWSAVNPRLNNYRPVVAEVVSVAPGDPTSITVRFTTSDDDEVEATTDRLVFVPPVGAPVPMKYDPADPEQVVMDGYNESSLLANVLIGLFAVTMGTAFLTFRRRNDG
jgi:hypothetical protein